MKSISLIGSGNVATHLGLALKKNNYQITQVYSRTLVNAEKLAAILNAGATNNLSALKTVDLIIISVKDNSITKVIKKTIIRINLNFGLIFNFRSSSNPRIKNNMQNDKNS